MSLKIVPFEPEYALYFMSLNTAWLEKYFYVEPKDILLMENCKSTIIDEGGHIFFAKRKDDIVGCFSLMKLTDRVFELGKMAVDENFQGMRIGQSLLSHAANFARENHWDKLVLYSSTKLSTALHIYRKFGFKEVILENNRPYVRGDIKMELVLNNL